jgi:hypothetical protein
MDTVFWDVTPWDRQNGSSVSEEPVYSISKVDGGSMSLVTRGKKVNLSHVLN